MRSRLRLLSALTLAFFLCSLVPAPVAALSWAETSEWIKGFPKRFFRRIVRPKEKIESPEELQKVFDAAKNPTFNGNEAQRDEKSSIMRPLKQVALAIGDGQIGILRQFLSFKGAELVKQVGKNAASSSAWAQARQVVASMGQATAGRLDDGLARSAFGGHLFQFLGKGGGFHQALLKEGNFALMAAISVLIDSGVYDGLDIDTFKDGVIAVAPILSQYTYSKQLPATIATAFVNRTVFDLSNNAFDVLYKRALSSQATWGAALRGLDAKSAALGESLFKAARQGAVQAGGQGPSLASRLGLVGVGEGQAFTLQGFTRAAAVGTVFALVGQISIDATAALVRGMPDRVVVGGNRDKYYVAAETNSWQYQKTGKDLKDWWEQRRILLRDVVDKRKKWPVNQFVKPFAAMVGGYAGSVVAGMLFAGGGAAVLVGGTLVSTLFAGLGAFVGNWLSVKIDRSAFMMNARRKGYVNRITREIKQMPIYREGRIDDVRVDEIAQARALDFEKLEKIGQVGSRILIVDDHANVRLGRKAGGDYVKMVIDDEHGSRFYDNADIRFDVIDLEGNRLLFDIYSNRLIDVGKVAENDGFGIVFVNGAKAQVEGDVLRSSDESGLHVYENGVILVQKDDEWVVRGQAAEKDLFFRDTGERFAWDHEAKCYRRAKGPADAAAPGAPVVAAGADPLELFAELLDEGDDEAFRRKLVLRSTAVVEKLHDELFERIDAIADQAALRTFLDGLGEKLGLEDLGGELVELNDVEAARERLRARILRYTEEAGRAIGKALQTTDGAALRESFAATRGAQPLADGPGRFAGFEARVQADSVWGYLSVLADGDALVTFALVD